MKLSSVLWDYLGGWEWKVVGGREVQKGGDICIHIADSSYEKPRQHIKKQSHQSANKGLYSQSFSSSHVQMWQWDHKEGWVPKNWHFWTVVPEKTLERPLDSKEIKPVHPIGNQPWIFIGRTDAEAEAPILWPPDANNWFTGKDPDAGKD